MKTKTLGILSLFFLLVFALSISCEKDDDSPVYKNLLYGLWTLDSADPVVLVNGKTPIKLIEDKLGITGALAQALIDEFLDDMASEMDLPSKINIKEDGTYVATLKNGSDEGSWILDGSLLTIDFGTADELKLVIILVSDSKLVLQMKETEKEDITEDGVDETLDITINMYFSK